MTKYVNIQITGIQTYDVRFPTSIDLEGSDAMHPDPDYSSAYCVLTTNSAHKGTGMAFTCGRGTEIIIKGITALKHHVIGKELTEIYDNFGVFWKNICNDGQLRWLGPEKGVIHMAVAAIINALWDLWGKIEGKPVWKLLADMTPEQILSLIDFTYITDVLSKDEALSILKKNESTKIKREKELLKNGYPAYVTSVGWIGYTDEKVRTLVDYYTKMGFTAFKVKVGTNLQDDKRRLSLIRNLIGPDKTLMVDANSIWEVQEAIDWMKELVSYKLLWIEEPTNCDDIRGQKAISDALKTHGIGVASGEHCQNRIMFKQFLCAGAMQFCQIDSCRLGGVNEILAVMLIAAKLNIPVCPHAGGVGLCEMVQHLSPFDYIAVSGSLENRLCEFADQLHEGIYINPCEVRNGCYILPKNPGYSTEFLKKTIDDYEFPTGRKWQELFDKKLFSTALDVKNYI